MKIFQDYAYYYNAFYKEKDYYKEAKNVDFLLKKYAESIKIKNLLDFGCGTGKHDVQLYQMGYQCTGIDVSPLMIEQAQNNVRGNNVIIQFEVADIRHYVPHGTYDAVISLFHVMSYQNSNEDILASFQSARRALPEKGIFLFDVWYGPGVLSNRPVVRVKEVEDEKNNMVRIARPVMYADENVVDVNYEVLVIDKKSGKTQMFSESHHMRYFFKPELEMILKQAGFELVANLDCHTLSSTDFNSWTSYFVARAF